MGRLQQRPAVRPTPTRARSAAGIRGRPSVSPRSIPFTRIPPLSSASLRARAAARRRTRWRRAPAPGSGRQAGRGPVRLPRRSPSRTRPRLFRRSRSLRCRLTARFRSLLSGRASVVSPSLRQPLSRPLAGPRSESSAQTARTRVPPTPDCATGSHPIDDTLLVLGRIPPLPSSRHDSPPCLDSIEQCPS